MKQHLLYIFLATILLMLPKLSTAQAPTLGTVADFVLFSSSGAVTNTGTTHLTGNAGTNLGASTGFGNIDGVIHDQNATSLQGAIDLTVAYNQLNSATPTFFPGASLGNGQTLNAGVYSISSPATLSLNLNLDAQGDPNAVFIFQINGSFTTGTGASITLLNGAQACNVFWKTEGLVSIAAGSTMRGTIVANNGDITMAAGDTLEGRAISTNGAISLTDVRAYLPLGCGVPALTGPAEPLLATTECFALFSASDPVSNIGSTSVTGDIGTNTGTTSGYNPLSVIGTIHTVPDAVTSQAAGDFTTVYNYLNTLAYDIELLFPAQLGNNLVLTPHVYQLNGATTLTDTLYLDAQGNPNAVFVFQVNGSFGAITASNVVLQNGAQAENVYWKIDGVTNISNNAVFTGTIVSQDDINLFTGSVLDGRALTGAGSITTNAAVVTAPSTCAPLTITEPADQTVCAGTTASFTVVASGSNLTYQWRRGNTNLVDAGNISGTTTATLTINPASVLDDANDYNVIISGDFVPDDTSNFASLTVLTAPSITTPPVDITACDGDSIAFVVGASGSGLTYQWRIGATNMVDGGEISGTTNDTLFINPASLLNASANYNVVLTGSCAPAVTSADVELTINSAPSITTQPTDQTACEGSSVSFSTVATGSGLTYQWQVGGVNITDGGTISGATTSTLTINPVAFTDEATDYSVIISGACAPADTSDMVFLQVDTLTSITTAPVDIVACEGDSIAFVVAANGSNMVYQWQIGATPIVDGGAISGATNDTLFINPVSVADASANYNVVVTGSCAPPAVSADVELTINTAPAITTQPTDQTVCEGSSVSFSTTATGSGLTYQWQVGGVNITDGGTISGATTSTLTINPVAFTDEATDYSVIISGACAPADTSNLVFLEVDTLTNITTMPVDITACAGDSIAFVVGASGSNLTYQWQIGATPLIDGGAISGATNDTLFINPVSVADASANYNVVVTGSCVPSVTSADVELTINTAPAITTQPTDQTVCEGSSVSFSTTATGSGLTYQWQVGGVNITDGGTISGATTSTLTINPVAFADEATDYSVIVSGACPTSDTSNLVFLEVDTLTSITTMPVDITACAGDSIAFVVGASGSNLTYQWQIGAIPLVDGGNISGATNDTLILNPVTLLNASANYNVVVSGSCTPSVTSADVELTINTAPAITTQPTDQTVCEGSSVSFSTTATGSGLTYQWQVGGVNITDGGTISGATTSTLTINPVAFTDEATDYSVIISGACAPADTSNLVFLEVDTLTNITTMPVDITACAGDSIAFVVGASGSNLTYQWQIGATPLVDGGAISGATNDTLFINPVSVADASANYNVVVSGSCTPSVTSADVELTINTAPAITTQPTDQTVCEGSSVSFSTTATGSGLTYQWQVGGVNITDGGTISGATTSTLTINPVAFADEATDYSVIISGACAPADTSNLVFLEVDTLTNITTMPVDITACAGDSIAFVVGASGSNLTYQWQIGAIPLVDGGNISGATNDTLILNPVTLLNASANYNVVVSGSCTPSVTSADVELTINMAPAILLQPTDQTVCEGSSVSFSTTALGSGLTYQWQVGGVNITDGGTISGATTSTLTINPVAFADEATDYSVIVSGACPTSDTSNLVFLEVDTLTSITTMPVDITACAGDSIAFVVGASGSNLTYQWQIGAIPLVDGGNISGSTNDTLIFNPVSAFNASANYNVVVSGSCTPSVTSADVELTINTAPAITTQPTDQTVCEGSSVSFSTTATGSGLTYQWQVGGVNITDGGTISGATTSTLTINPVAFTDEATDYSVIISGACAPADTSNLVFLEVDTMTTITTMPVDVTACAGDSIAFVVVADGSNLTYQWQIGATPLVDGGTISGSTTDTLIINPVSAADASANYNVVVTGSCVPSVTSADVELTINTAPAITTQPTDQTVCEGSSVSFSTTATGSGLTYQWQVGGVNITDGGTISGATTSTLTINPVAFTDEATDYSVIISGACAPADTSNLVFLEVDTMTTITTMPVDIAACAGDSIAFVVVADGSNLTYQWQIGATPLVDGGTISGSTNDTLIINPVSAADVSANYNVVVTGSCVPSVTSTDVELTINTAPVITTQPTDQTICEGSSVTFTATATGSGLTYQWRKGAQDVTDGGSISGATTSTLMINPATFADEATDYYVVVYGACQPNDTSDMVSLQVDSITTVTTAPVDITVCAGDSVAFVVAATGSNLTYQWRRGLTNMTDGGPVSGATNDTLIINPATSLYAGNNYNVVITGGCLPAVVTADVELTIGTAPQITTQPTDQTVCEGSSVTFSTVASGSNLIYQWRKGATNLTNGGAISGATSANLTINPTAFSDIATDYNVVITGDCPSGDTSVLVALQVDTMSVIVTQPTDVVVCTGDSVIFEVVAEGSNLTYQWRRGLTDLADGGSISGATTATLMINPVALSDAATDYNVVITGGCVSPMISDNVELDASDCFNDLSVVKGASTMSPTIGENMTFVIVASNIGGNATNVTVTDILQSGYTYVTHSTTSGTYDPMTGVWNIGSMLDSTSETLTIGVTVNDTGNYVNTAVITGNGDSNPDNNSSTVEPLPANYWIPEGFSPNGDGVNDVFVIRGILNHPNNEIRIFNRWGSLVYEASPYQNEWDGRSNSGANVGGDVLPVGTYFYVLEPGDGTDPQKGTIYLNK